MGLLTLVSLFGFAATITRVARIPPATALLQATACIILLLYTGALAGALWVTALTILVAGVVMLGYELLRIVRSRTRPEVPVSWVVSAVLVALFWLVHGQSEYRMYDEYSHWGIYLKEMLAFDAFWPADTNAMHPRYPPGPTLWQYLFNAFQTPTEGKAYLAQFVLLIAPLLVLWHQLTWRQAGWIVGILAACVHVVASYGLGVSSMYVDPLIAAWLVGVVLAALADAEPMTNKRLLLNAAPLAAMALLKDTGLAFALSAAAIIVGIAVHREWRMLGALRSTRRGALSMLLLSAPAFLSIQLWSMNRDGVGAPIDAVSVTSIVTGVIDGVAEQDAAITAEVGSRFRTVFATQQLANDEVSWRFNEFSYGIRHLFMQPFRLTTLGLLILFVMWFGVLISVVVERNRRWTWGIVAGGMLATAAGYLTLLYLSYPFMFGAELGPELPSYVRYVNSLTLPMVLLALTPLLPGFRSADANGLANESRRTRARAAVFITGLAALWILEPPYLRPLTTANESIPLRREIEPMTIAIQDAVKEGPLLIYFPQDQPNGMIGRLLQYMLAPTVARVQRSPTFFDREESNVRSELERFEYLWIPVPPPPEISAKLAPFVAGESVHGLFRLATADEGGRVFNPVSQ